MLKESEILAHAQEAVEEKLAGIMSSRKRDSVLMDKIAKYLEIREGVKVMVAAAQAREKADDLATTLAAATQTRCLSN